jgi:O-antigen/teichoic acid export membrane protein
VPGRSLFTRNGHTAAVGLPVSLILIAVGAILAFAVHQDPNPTVDIDVVGWVLMLVGLAGILLSLFWWERFGPGAWGWHRGPYPPGGPPPGGQGRRRTVVEEDEPPGPPPPP